MITPENITVPANIRKQFDTSKINTEINNLEEIVKDNQVLGDSPYVPTPDERSLNVVERIKDTSKFYQEDSSEESLAEFTNVWDYKAGVTPKIDIIGDICCVISYDITDPKVFQGAIITDYEGNVSEVTEEPTSAEMDGVYLTGPNNFITVITKPLTVEGVRVPAGTYTGYYPDSDNPLITKIVATSAIFHVQ